MISGNPEGDLRVQLLTEVPLRRVDRYDFPTNCFGYVLNIHERLKPHQFVQKLAEMGYREVSFSEAQPADIVVCGDGILFLHAGKLSGANMMYGKFGNDPSVYKHSLFAQHAGGLYLGQSRFFYTRGSV